jgi:hypothetical protein
MQQNTQELDHWIVLEVSDYGFFAASRLRVRPLPQESHSSPFVSIFRCFVRRSPGYHAKARSREVPMRDGQFLPHLTLKRSLFNERTVGQPGQTGEYLYIYKN